MRAFLHRGLMRSSWLGVAAAFCGGAALSAQSPNSSGGRIPVAAPVNIAATNTTGGVATAAPAIAPPANYLLSANDLVQIKVFQEDDMNWTVRVTKDGTVILPLVGSIGTAHKTPDELANAVRDRLLDGWLVHPQVSVTVLEFSKRRFTILGQIVKPGQIDFPDNSTLNILDAIGMAGGFTTRADPGHVYVKRTVGSKQVVLKLDARRMQRDARAESFEVLPGDTITVSETVF